MDNELLKQAIADAKAVRMTSLNNAQQAMNQALSNSITNRGYFITGTSELGVKRYNYDISKQGDENALEDIEKEGLIILDEDEEEHWIDVIKAEDMANNIKEGIKPLPEEEKVFKEVLPTFEKIVKSDKNKSLWEKLFGI